MAPVYSIQRDHPWMSHSAYHVAPAPMVQPSYYPSYHAHPHQQIKENGAQLRRSRLPVLKNARPTLPKPPPLTTTVDPPWAQHTRTASDPAYTTSKHSNPYMARSQGPPITGRRRVPRRDHSPVSMLRDEDITPIDSAREKQFDLSARSPVSPISAPSLAEDDSDDEFDQSLLPEPLSPNIPREPAPPGPRTPPNPRHFKRKPVSRGLSAGENQLPTHDRSLSQSSDLTITPPDGQAALIAPANSHFSWTTYATSIAPGRASIDTMATKAMPELPDVTQSRFSWSTIATTTTQRARPETPTSSPPPLPPQHVSPPEESVLSRRRPIQRYEKEEWNPPTQTIRIGSQTIVEPTKSASAPLPATTLKGTQFGKILSLPTTDSPISTTGKALPPPPQLSSDNNLNHMETLLAQERDIYLQRHNVERAIRELEKVEKASPLDVPFARVRDAKRNLVEYRTRLDEVRLEERDIGVAIARARRREDLEAGGDGQTLWVRRVTG